MTTSSSTTHLAYESPKVEDLGDLVALTAQASDSNNNQKPCIVSDGMSGTNGNMSDGGCGS